MSEERENMAITRAYFAALERGDEFKELGASYDPEAIQIEHPNRLVSAGATRDLQGLAEAHRRGSLAVEGQRYEIHQLVAQGDSVAVRLSWSARTKLPFGHSPAGSSMKAEFAMFLAFRGGRIVRQHNYDCFAEF